MEVEIQLLLKSFPGSSVSSLIQAGWCEEGQKIRSNIPRIDNCLMVTKQDFLEMEASLTKREILSVAKGWLSTVCCWEADAHTLDLSWKKMDVKLMMMMMMMRCSSNRCTQIFWRTSKRPFEVQPRRTCVLESFSNCFNAMSGWIGWL